jgi:BolA protein
VADKKVMSPEPAIIYGMTRVQKIERQIRQELAPSDLVVENESHRHNVPAESETHFKIVVVSEKFQGQTLVQRHRVMQQLLAYEFKNGLHALALHTFTPEEWRQKQGAAESPKCLGGTGK